MGGGYIQAVAYGSQDIYLTGNPQITFFKAAYKRHTNFAVESIEVGYLGNADFGGKVVCTLPTHGDLVKDIFIEWEINDTTNLVPSDGTWLFKQMDLEIGGQLIDRQYADWLKIWSELTTPGGKFTGYQQMTGDYTAIGGTAPDSNKFIVPLQFWFCRHSGLALPLIALSAAEVKLTLYLETSDKLQKADDAAAKSITSFKIWVDYIFMDTDERRRFAQSGHEYLIEQVQTIPDNLLTNGTNVRIPLEFNFPVKELLWWGRRTWEQDNENSFNDHYMTFTEGHLALNGAQRFYQRRSEYFLNVQNYEHHNRVPRYDLTYAFTNNLFANYIYTYSFALEPENHQPSGVCNFTRLKSADLYLDGIDFTPPPDTSSGTGIIRVFAHGYNVLRIMSGMAGLAYSN
jgi:hypothetical protein